MTNVVDLNVNRAVDASGNYLAGAKAYFYQSGTSTPVTVYADAAATTPHATPVVADGSGVFPAIYAAGSVALKVNVTTSSGAAVPGYPRDPVVIFSDTSVGASSISFAPITGNGALNVQAAIANIQPVVNDISTAARTVTSQATIAAMRTALDVPEAGNITTADIAAATLVTAADTVRSNDNDTTLPTTAAVKAYADGTLATAQVTTSGTAFDFTGLPAGVRRLVVMFGGCSLSGTDDLLVQIGDSGGLATSGYAASCFDHAGMVNSNSGFIVYTGAAANTVHGSITLTLLNSSTNRWVAQIGAYRSTTSAIGGGGGVVLSGALDRVRLTRTGTDTFDAGSVSIWYR